MACFLGLPGPASLAERHLLSVSHVASSVSHFSCLSLEILVTTLLHCSRLFDDFLGHRLERCVHIFAQKKAALDPESV